MKFSFMKKGRRSGPSNNYFDRFDLYGNFCFTKMGHLQRVRNIYIYIKKREEKL